MTDLRDIGYRRAEIVAEARGWVGTPYRHRASVKGAGADCLGLVRGVWRAFHGAEPAPLPAYTPDWAEAGGRERLAEAGDAYLRACPVEAARPGDVLLFRLTPRHVAKHAGLLSRGRVGAGGFFIHAHEGAAVAEVRLVAWWRRRIACAFRFPAVRD